MSARTACPPPSGGRFPARARRRRDRARDLTRARTRRTALLEPLEERCLLALLGIATLGTKPDISSGVINDLSFTLVGNNANPFHSFPSVPPVDSSSLRRRARMSASSAISRRTFPRRVESRGSWIL
jgi:hypothetical protein